MTLNLGYARVETDALVKAVCRQNLVLLGEDFVTERVKRPIERKRMEAIEKRVDL